MADAPIATTISLELGKWGDKKNPGFVALNDNWEKIDAAIMATGDEFPDVYQVGKLFLRTDESIIYWNTGTEDEPVFLPLIDVQTLADAVAGKADQSSLDDLASDFADFVTDFEAAGFFKADGSVAMTGDIDMGTNEVANAKNGTTPQSLATVAQLDAAISAAEGLLGTKIAAQYIRTTERTSADGGEILLFESVVYNRGGLVDVSDLTSFVVPQDGDYVVNFGGLIAGISNTYTNLKVIKDVGAGWVDTTARERGTHVSGYGGVGSTHNLTSDPIPLVAGDKLALFCQSDGGTGKITWGQYTNAQIPGVFTIYMVASNASGAGDLKSTGEVAMQADFDLGGNEAINAADATTPTALTTLQQVEAADQALQDQIDDITEGQLDTDEAEMVGGSQAFSGTGWTVITGSAKVFTLDAAKKVSLNAEATLKCDFLGRLDGQLGIRVTKTAGATNDYKGTSMVNGYGYNDRAPLVASKKLSLIAGEYTIEMIVRQRVALGASCAIEKTADEPARLGYEFTG